MSKRSLNEMLNISLDNISKFIDTSKVVGEPVVLSQEEALIPISRVTFGFGSGGSEFKNRPNAQKGNDSLLFEYGEDTFPYGGGSLGGVAINPEAFLHIKNGECKIIRVDKEKSIYEKAFEAFTKMMK